MCSGGSHFPFTTVSPALLPNGDAKLELISRRMISFRLGSCLSKLERVKENIFKVSQFGE